MNLISETIKDVKTIIHYRKQVTTWQKKHESHVPKVGEMATDFTLYDSTGIQSITLSDFRGKRPVVLAFGSFT